jgi:hypothetical protein
LSRGSTRGASADELVREGIRARVVSAPSSRRCPAVRKGDARWSTGDELLT